MESTSLTKQHISVRIYKAYILFIRKYYPTINIEKICSDAGLPFEYLTDESNWVSIIFDFRFIELCIEQTGESNLCQKVGEQGWSKESLGAIVFTFVRHGLSIKQKYRQGAKIASHLNKLLKIEVIKETSNSFLWRAYLNKVNLSTEEIEAANKSVNFIMDYTIGLTKTAPVMHGFQRAKVTGSKEASEELAFIISCRYQNSHVGIILIYFVLLLGALLWLARGFQIIYFSPHNIRLAVEGFLFLLTFYIFVKSKKLETALLDCYNDIEVLERQYEQIVQKDTILERNLSESKLINEVIKILVSVKSREEIRRTVAKKIVESIYCERCFFLEKNASETSINKEYFGFSGNKKSYLEAASFLNGSFASSSFQTQGVFFNNPSELGAELNISLGKFLENLEAKAFIISPIYFGKVLFGYLYIDVTEKNSKFDYRIVSLIDTIARQVAISFHGLAAIEENNHILVTTARDTELAKISKMVAHDIRSPLSTLEIVFKSLKNIPADSEQLFSLAIGRIKGISEQLLEKYRSFNLNKKVVKFSVNEVINSIIQEKEVLIKGFNISIEAKYFNEMHQIFLDIDPFELGAILSNLLDNSIEAIGESKGKIEVWLRTNEKYIFININDNGPGIPPDLLNKMGTEGETHGKTNGTGLGLFSAKLKIKSWGGSFKIYSKNEGSGTTIEIVLPKDKSH